MLESINFDNSYRQDFRPDASDKNAILSSIAIDWFPKDPDKEGKVIAEVNLTMASDIIVAWRSGTDRYRNNKTVLSLIEDSKKQLLDEYPDLKQAAKV